MRKLILLLWVLLLTVIIFTACSDKNASVDNTVVENIVLKYPDFEKFITNDNMREKKLDVLRLSITSNSMSYTDIGIMENMKLYLSSALRYSYGYPIDTGVTQYELPIYFFDNTVNCEGIIVFERVPYAFYYNDDGEAFVKCLEMRFNDYFKEDKTYDDFIAWARDYKPRIDDEDLLSR